MQGHPGGAQPGYTQYPGPVPQGPGYQQAVPYPPAAQQGYPQYPGQVPPGGSQPAGGYAAQPAAGYGQPGVNYGQPVMPVAGQPAVQPATGDQLPPGDGNFQLPPNGIPTCLHVYYTTL